MNLYALKPWFVRRLGRTVALADRRGVTPDQVTALGAGLGVATGAAVAAGTVWPLAWVAVAPLAIARLAANAVDGQLARGTGAATRRGAVANELADRVGDLAALAPLALVAPLATAVLLVALLLAEWASALHWAVHHERRYAGPFGKPDRMVVLALGLAVAVVWPVAAVGTAVVLAVGVAVASVVRVAVALEVVR